ncbi:DUF3597 domain-containing protein [Neorhizobium sp. T786]|uniref:DUF3597 domain-containing protein n=1 Tax=Pseudorhizobium xiangyangii TaxID=2883104 RepID=UPI001CFF7B77|nr:DUF3597 domain-containing protein [Neorhizobium xiangyangii]MCB5201371.1 DUF3597 domain-containing protein [Neorhizobium xiangyangii]
MGIFDKIKNAIWGEAQAAPAPQAQAPAPGQASAPTASSAPSSTSSPQPATKPAASATSSPAGGSSTPVDVAPILDAAVKKNGQKLDWRRSIVDLMKSLDLDSSLGARKELAKELNYTGDTNDSATMNMWLHKALMRKLAENGGKIPADLTD